MVYEVEPLSAIWNDRWNKPIPCELATPFIVRDPTGSAYYEYTDFSGSDNIYIILNKPGDEGNGRKAVMLSKEPFSYSSQNDYGHWPNTSRDDVYKYGNIEYTYSFASVQTNSWGNKSIPEGLEIPFYVLENGSGISIDNYTGQFGTAFLYGDFNEENVGNATIPVQWESPYDKKMYETTFPIKVTR